MPPSGMGDLEDLFEPGPENESSPWRLPDRAYAVSDIIGAAAGISLYAVVGIDNVVSWPSNQVLISEQDLSNIAGVLLIPTWVWLIFSVGIASGRTQSWRLSQLPASIPPLAGFVRSRRRVPHGFRARCRHRLHRPPPSAPRSYPLVARNGPVQQLDAASPHRIALFSRVISRKCQYDLI